MGQRGCNFPDRPKRQVIPAIKATHNICDAAENESARLFGSDA